MPYCSSSGTEIAESAAAYPQCGHPRRVASGARPTEGNAIAALQAHNKIGQNPELEGESMARDGVILGWIGVGLGLLGIAAAVLGLIISAAIVGTLG